MRPRANATTSDSLQILMKTNIRTMKQNVRRPGSQPIQRAATTSCTATFRILGWLGTTQKRYRPRVCHQVGLALFGPDQPLIGFSLDARFGAVGRLGFLSNNAGTTSIISWKAKTSDPHLDFQDFEAAIRVAIIGFVLKLQSTAGRDALEWLMKRGARLAAYETGGRFAGRLLLKFGERIAGVGKVYASELPPPVSLEISLMVCIIGLQLSWRYRRDSRILGRRRAFSIP
jgi:hypothetical protein